jgi:hypothetical protein
MLSRILSFLKANPAIAGGLVSALITLAAGFGLTMTPGQLAVFAAIIGAASHGVVHLATNPAGKHEEAPREEHG